VDEQQGIYRGEVMTIMGALGDLPEKVDRLLDYAEGDDDGREEEEDDPS
jgi:hypothetical protein